MTAGAQASWDGPSDDDAGPDDATSDDARPDAARPVDSGPVEVMTSAKAIEAAALSLSSSRLAATERLRAMDDFEAAHSDEPLEGSRD